MHNATGEKNVCVIITSVIDFSSKKLSYTKHRSIFSIQERIEHTKRSVMSVRKKIPGCKIFIFELGLSDFSHKFADIVDSYYFIGNKFLLRKVVDSKFKGLGEAVGLLFAINKIPSDFQFIFKMSGRYFLNSNFNICNWNSKKFIFLLHNNSVSTRLYGLGKNKVIFWIISLLLSIPLLLFGLSIEKAMCIFIPKKLMKKLDNLGLSGYISVDGGLIEE